jgi:NaMN:DMB phosphoribosyltransferase
VREDAVIDCSRVDGVGDGGSRRGHEAVHNHRRIIVARGDQCAEHAHGKVLEHLGVRPYLDLGMRLGEGSGAALAMLLAKTALNLHLHMATFASAGVSGKD